MTVKNQNGFNFKVWHASMAVAKNYVQLGKLLSALCRQTGFFLLLSHPSFLLIVCWIKHIQCILCCLESLHANYNFYDSFKYMCILPFQKSWKKVLNLTKFSSLLHSGMFPKVLYRCENIGRQDESGNFWHFLKWIQSFFKPIEFLGLNKVNWVEKRLNSYEKMSKISKIILSADVFTTKQNLDKHSNVQSS